MKKQITVKNRYLLLTSGGIMELGHNGQQCQGQQDAAA
jgi:hypothetical protein